MHDPSKGIYFPERLEVSAFRNGEWRFVGELEINQPGDGETASAQEFGVELTDCMTPQVRLRIVSRRIPGSQEPSCMLIDELVTH